MWCTTAGLPGTVIKHNLLYLFTPNLTYIYQSEYQTTFITDELQNINREALQAF